MKKRMSGSSITPVTFPSLTRKKAKASSTLNNSTKSLKERREKVARLKYSRDYSFLFPVEDNEDSKQNGGKFASQVTVQSNRQKGSESSAMKVEGLDERKSTGSKKLVLRWRLTADGKAKIIKDPNLDKIGKLPCTNLEVDEAERQRYTSFVIEIFKTIMKDPSMKGKNIFKKRDMKPLSNIKVEEEKGERIKICRPRWKRICGPKVSLGAPRLGSRSVSCRKRTRWNF